MFLIELLSRLVPTFYMNIRSNMFFAAMNYLSNLEASMYMKDTVDIIPNENHWHHELKSYTSLKSLFLKNN